MNYTIVHHVYALLDDEDIVRDLIYASSEEEAKIIAKRTYVYGKAYCVDEYPVSINDFYLNKKFYHRVDDTEYYQEVVKVTSDQDRINDLLDIIQEKNNTIKYLEKRLNDSKL